MLPARLTCRFLIFIASGAARSVFCLAIARCLDIVVVASSSNRYTIYLLVVVGAFDASTSGLLLRSIAHFTLLRYRRDVNARFSFGPVLKSSARPMMNNYCFFI